MAIATLVAYQFENDGNIMAHKSANVNHATPGAFSNARVTAVDVGWHGLETRPQLLLDFNKFTLCQLSGEGK